MPLFTESTIAAGIFGYAYESGGIHLAFIRCESNGQVTAEGQSGHSYKAEMLGSWGSMNPPAYSEIVVKDCKKGTSTITYENVAGSYDKTGGKCIVDNNKQ